MIANIYVRIFWSALRVNEINCPQCGKVFKIDETGYADILRQVRDEYFEQQLSERLLLAEKDKINALELAKQKNETELREYSSSKEIEIQKLRAKLNNAETEKKLALSEAKSSSEKQRDELVYKLKKLEEVQQKEFKQNEIRQKFARC